MTLIEEVEEARGELGAALSQALPTDDQIIIGHVRAAYNLLGYAVKELKAQGEKQP